MLDDGSAVRWPPLRDVVDGRAILYEVPASFEHPLVTPVEISIPA